MNPLTLEILYPRSKRSLALHRSREAQGALDPNGAISDFLRLTWLIGEGLRSQMTGAQIKDAQIKILLIRDVFQIHYMEGRGGINLVTDKKGISVQATKNRSDTKHSTSMFIIQYKRS